VDDGFARSLRWRRGCPRTPCTLLTSNAAAIEVLSGILGQGDKLLIKGSRSMGMDSIVSAFGWSRDHDSSVSAWQLSRSC